MIVGGLAAVVGIAVIIDGGARDKETYREETGEPGGCGGAGVCESGSSDSE